MALSASNRENGFSLEDELAEATKDLLDLGISDQKDRKAKDSINLHLSTPSPFLLSRPGSSNRLDISKALSIDPNARLTPIHDRGDKQRNSLASSSSPSLLLQKNDRSDDSGANEQEPNIHDKDQKFPSSNLNGSVKSVSVDLLSPFVRKSVTSSPGLQAIQDTLREHSWLNRNGEKVTSQGKIEKRMELFSARNIPASAGPIGSASTGKQVVMQKLGSVSAGPRSDRNAQQDHIPAFFQESFPDWVKEENVVRHDAIASSSTSKRKEGETNISEDSQSNILPRHYLQSVQPTDAIATQESVTVKLHANRRAEREAILIESDRQDDQQYFNRARSDSLDSHLSSPIQEIVPNPTEDDVNSLMSLPATTATSSSNTSSARKRKSLARRKSNGSHSYMTGESVENCLTSEYTLTPFARDVHIRGFSIVGEKARGYVAYDVRIVTHAGSTISILKRFSAFVNLRKALIDEGGTRHVINKSSPSGSRFTMNDFKNAGSVKTKGQFRPIPQLPPKRSGLLQKYASDHLEKRRRALQKWLAIIMLDPVWGTTRAVRQFVVGTDDI